MKIVLYEKLITTKGRNLGHNHQREYLQEKDLDRLVRGEREERILSLIVIPRKGGIIRQRMKTTEDMINDNGQEVRRHRQRSIVQTHGHMLQRNRNQASLMLQGLLSLQYIAVYY